jgi:sensor histidine kinase YesM
MTAYAPLIGGQEPNVADVLALVLSQQALGFALFLAVRIAEQGILEPGWRRYLLAFVGAILASTVLSVGVHTLLGVPSRGVVSPELPDWQGALDYHLSLFSSGLLASGLILLMYVRIQAARRAQANFARAEMERATASRQVLASRLAAMQAQVEPRFLFNTLAQVEALYDRDPRNADRLLDDLIAYLRAALPQLRREGSTLGRETELAEAYLHIMQVRMGSRLEFGFDIPQESADANFPPMMLLPLIDNALRHGLEPLPLGGRIEVRARCEGQRVRLTVADNGVGHANELVEGTGLATLRERLHGLYGQDAGLAISSAAPQGIEATIDVRHEAAGSDR